MGQLVASRLELLVEDSVGQLVAVRQRVCEVGAASHHLLHRTAIEG